MPGGISGLDLARSVKKDARKTKVFLMTAFDISPYLNLSKHQNHE
jgi:hypothetical protein